MENYVTPSWLPCNLYNGRNFSIQSVVADRLLQLGQNRAAEVETVGVRLKCKERMKWYEILQKSTVSSYSDQVNSAVSCTFAPRLYIFKPKCTKKKPSNLGRFGDFLYICTFFRNNTVTGVGARVCARVIMSCIVFTYKCTNYIYFY